MYRRAGLVLGLCAALAACSGESSDGMGGDDAGVDDCPSGGEGRLVFELELPAGEVEPELIATAEDGTTTSIVPGAINYMLPAGSYEFHARRLYVPGTLVGTAYQGVLEETGPVCVRDGENTTLHIAWKPEPGSQKLWASNANADALILAFDAADLATVGMQEPDVTLGGGLAGASALRVDALGRLWVGDAAGKLSAFASDRLGATSTEGPDIVLDGPALCGDAIPCGPRAMAFDADGALWVALLERVVKLSPASLEASGQPTAEVTITSADIAHPISLAFDADGSLWVGEADTSGVAKFAAARLADDITDGAADVVIHGQQEGPVMIGLGSPDGLAFDPDGNLWVGYWAANDLARYTPEELTETATLIPTVQFNIGATALMTDLAIDESGNLWAPGVMGTIVRIDAAQLTAEAPTVNVLRSTAIGSVEKIALHSVAGPLFIAP